MNPRTDLSIAITRSLYRKWGLQGLATWELPVPIRPELTKPSALPYSELSSEAGMLLFVPWYLMRDKDVKLHELADVRRTMGAPPDLDDWLDGEPANWGYERFGLMLQIYVFLELAIARRYGDRIRRRTGKLDHALSRFFCRERGEEQRTESYVDTVRRVRQRLHRCLPAKKQSGIDAG